MSLIGNETIAWVDPYALENELLDLDDDDQREEYDRQRKLIAKRQKRSRTDRIGRESVLEVPKTACIVHVAVGSNVIVTVNSQNKLTVSDISDSVKGGTWDIAQMLQQADDGSRRMIPGDKVSKLFLDPLGRQILLVFEKNSAALHISLKNMPKEGESSSKGNPSKHILELRPPTAAASGVGDKAEQALTGALSGIGLNIGSSSSSSSSQSCPLVESLAWSPWNALPASSGSVVLGAKTGGQIWGARLEASGVNEVKRLFVLPNERAPITAVYQDRSRDPIDSRYLNVYVATQTTLYIFFGKGSPESVFSHCNVESIGKADWLNHHYQSFHPSNQVQANALAPRRTNTEQETVVIALPAPYVAHHHTSSSSTTTSTSSSSTSRRPISFQSCHTTHFNCFWYSHVAEQQGLSGQWMWTHKEGVSFGTLPPPGFAASPILNGTISYQTIVEAQQQQFVNSSSAGAQQSSSSSKSSIKIFSSCIAGFGLYLSTDLGVTAIAHPAVIPWISSSSSSSTNDKNRRWTMLKGPRNPTGSSYNNDYNDDDSQQQQGKFGGFGGGGNAAASTTTDDAIMQMMLGSAATTKMNNDDDNLTSGNDLFSNMMNSNNNNNKRNSSDAKQQQQDLSSSLFGCIRKVTSIESSDIRQRTFYSMPSGTSVKDGLRTGGGFGCIKDPATAKVYLYTPLELFEMHIPSLRRQMFPLFLDHMLEMASSCLVAPPPPLSTSLTMKSSSSSSSSKKQQQKTQTSLTNQQQQVDNHSSASSSSPSDFCSRLHAIRSCDLASRSYSASETQRLGFDAGRSLASRLKFFNAVRSYGNSAPTTTNNNNTNNNTNTNNNNTNSGVSAVAATSGASLERMYHNATDAERDVACSFLHAMHMCNTVAGKIKSYHALLARTASRCFSDMGAFSCAAPLLADAHHQISVTESLDLLSSSPAPSLSSQMHGDELSIMERDRLLAYELYGRQTIQRMNEERTFIGQYRQEIYCLVHWLVLVMVERCRRAEVYENQIMTATGAPSPTAIPLSPADLHEIESAQRYVTDDAATAVEHAQAAVRDMTSEQMPRFTVFKQEGRRRQSHAAGGGAGGAASLFSSSSSPTAASRARSNTFNFMSDQQNGMNNTNNNMNQGGDDYQQQQQNNAAREAAEEMMQTFLGALTLSVTSFIQHHMTTGHLSFNVIERAVLAAASPRLASLVFVIMQEFGVVLRNLIARGNFTAAARVLSQYCCSSDHKSYWRTHAQALMVHCPLDFLSAELVENVSTMNFQPEDLVCMLAPAAVHNVKYSGRLEHTQMCRAVVAVLRAFLENPSTRSLTLEKQTIMMMTLYNQNDELVEFISRVLEADYIDLDEDEATSRKSSFSGFALRQCAKSARVAGLAEVLFRQGLCFDAVRLLVQAGLNEEARDYAHRVTTSKEEQHKCWSEIVHRAVERDPIQGSNDALDYLKESEGVLSVYDVFPELSEAVPMKALGQGLIEAVNEVAEQMKQTQHDVETARQITQKERAQGDRVRHGTVNVSATKECDVCRGPLLGGNSSDLVYYASCGHGFHIACHPAKTGNDGLLGARESAPAGSLIERCPLCSDRGILDFLTAPIDLPFGHPANNFV